VASLKAPMFLSLISLWPVYEYMPPQALYSFPIIELIRTVAYKADPRRGLRTNLGGSELLILFNYFNLDRTVNNDFGLALVFFHQSLDPDLFVQIMLFRGKWEFWET